MGSGGPDATGSGQFVRSEMDGRQTQTHYVISSIAVGIVTFCVTVLLALVVGGILHGQLQTDALIPPKLRILFTISGIVGLILGMLAGMKYYRYARRIE